MCYLSDLALINMISKPLQLNPNLYIIGGRGMVNFLILCLILCFWRCLSRIDQQRSSGNNVTYCRPILCCIQSLSVGPTKYFSEILEHRVPYLLLFFFLLVQNLYSWCVCKDTGRVGDTTVLWSYYFIVFSRMW